MPAIAYSDEIPLLSSNALLYDKCIRQQASVVGLLSFQARGVGNFRTLPV